MDKFQGDFQPMDEGLHLRHDEIVGSKCCPSVQNGDMNQLGCCVTMSGTFVSVGVRVHHLNSVDVVGMDEKLGSGKIK